MCARVHPQDPARGREAADARECPQEARLVARVSVHFPERVVEVRGGGVAELRERRRGAAEALVRGEDFLFSAFFSVGAQLAEVLIPIAAVSNAAEDSRPAA